MINLALKNSEAAALHGLLELVNVLASDRLSEAHRSALLQGVVIDSNLHSITPRLKTLLDVQRSIQAEQMKRPILTATPPASIEDAIDASPKLSEVIE